MKSAGRWQSMRAGEPFRWLVRASGLLALAWIATASSLWAAAEVRRDESEIGLVTLWGAVWLFCASGAFSWLGLSVRDDAIERRNVAALVALISARFGAACIYAGSSVGEGESYAQNMLCVALGALVWFGLWAAFELCTRVANAVAVERDVASGLRLGAYLVASGALLGRALAGTWHSVDATLADLVREAWPVLVLWALGVVVERAAQPTPRHSSPAWASYGLAPALVYLAASLCWLAHLGAWEGMPR